MILAARVRATRTERAIVCPRNTVTVKHSASGRRYIELEVEVPGTPEEVWQAIATGPGISGWFFPAEVEERPGGRVVWHMEPGVDAPGAITAWEPPRRLGLEEPSGWRPGAPALATEWTIEPRAGGTCVVRLVHSLFVDASDWDGELEGIEANWQGFFGILQLYLKHFRGQRAAIVRVTGSTSGTERDVWTALLDALGIADAAAGQPWRTPVDGAPPLSGTVERIVERPLPHALLRIDDPLPGIAAPIVYTMDDRVMTSLGIYLYGDDAPAIAARDEPLWQAWLNELFE